jgi:hypothetical protein
MTEPGSQLVRDKEFGEGQLSTMPIPTRDNRVPTQAEGAGLGQYLREAFLFRWNLLFFLGATAAAAMAPFPEVFLPIVAAGELTYLTSLVAIPRFRAAIDAKVHAAGKGVPGANVQPPPLPLTAVLASLPPEARGRFERLHARCREMRTIAAGVRGAASGDVVSTDEIRTPGLDRMLWLFLRLLVSKTALERFLKTMNEKEIATRLDQLRASLATAQTANEERTIRSLQDSIAMTELRLDNYGRAKKNAEFVSLELDRLEGKIQALAEMAVNRQDPDFLSSQVDSAAESMRQTEKSLSELQHLTGLAEQLEEPPQILESDLKEVLRREA